MQSLLVRLMITVGNANCSYSAICGELRLGFELSGYFSGFLTYFEINTIIQCQCCHLVAHVLEVLFFNTYQMSISFYIIK